MGVIIIAHAVNISCKLVAVPIRIKIIFSFIKGYKLAYKICIVNKCSFFIIQISIQQKYFYAFIDVFSKIFLKYFARLFSVIRNNKSQTSSVFCLFCAKVVIDNKIITMLKKPELVFNIPESLFIFNMLM